MMTWVPYALVRVALCFIAGILLAIYLPGVIPFRVALVVVIGTVFIYVLMASRLGRMRWGKIFMGLLGFTAIFLSGYLHLFLKTDSRKADHLLAIPAPVSAYEAVVRSAPESKERSWKITVEVMRVKDTAWRKAQGKVLLYVSKKTMPVISWKYGDRLLIKGSPVELRSPANPDEFDFKRFLSFRNIYHQHFIQGDAEKIASVQRKGFTYYALEARAWATEKIRTFIVGEQEQTIAMALILGVTDAIDSDLRNAYAASGAMHVLAVSGLHVGIIYGIVLLLLRPLGSSAASRWTTAAISLLCLWVFAFFTGLSPSVLRAVTMFSFIAIARPLGWRTNIYNTLAASAFLLLLYDPYLILSVGFQLSYLAVLGIVYLQKPMYNLWDIENKAGDWIWQITCVSIAAQIATFALSMFYFHQFPVYFLLTNLFVIPLSTFILVAGIVLLAASAWTWLATLIGKAVTLLVQGLNWIVFEVEEWPLSIIQDIHLSAFQCWLVMAMLCALILLFEYRSMKWLYASAVVCLLLTATQWKYMASMEKHEFIVYGISGSSAMEWIDSGRSYFKADSALREDQEKIRFHIRPHRLERGVKHTLDTLPFSKAGEGFDLVRWQAKTILLLQEKEHRLPQALNVDLLVVSGNALSLKEAGTLVFKKVILDGSNSRGYISRWKEYASANQIELHTVADAGAFILTD